MPAPMVACRNPVCSSESAGSRVAAGGATIVSCRRCGFTCMERDGRRLRVLRYGPIWERRLGELVAMPEAALRWIALQLGVDATTVKQQAQRLGVQRPTWRVRDTSSESAADRRKALGRHRDVWKQLRIAHPLEGRSTLRERAPATYTYLRRYDRTWFEQHQPPRARPDHRRPRVDWHARDAEMLVLARAAVSRLRDRTRPVRISLRAIAGEMGHVSLIEQHLDRIPETATFLRDAVESRVEFAARKVALIGAARAGKAPLPRWLLARRANLRPELVAEVADELELWTSTEGGCYEPDRDRLYRRCSPGTRSAP
ncbi:MAG: TnsD family Tn7-like transposition protein [Longimicrobiaceae bacterium]